MIELNLKELEELYQKDRVSYHKTRTSLKLEASYKKDDFKLNLFDSITKSLFRREIKKITLMLTEYRFRGFKLYYEEEYDEEPELVILKQVDDDWEKDKHEEVKSNFHFLKIINRFIDGENEVDKLNYDHDEIKNIGIGIAEILNNQFFKEQVNSVLLFNKLDEKLEEKNFVRKILKI